jgi:predicted double-glycine peptidase
VGTRRDAARALHAEAATAHSDRRYDAADTPARSLYLSPRMGVTLRTVERTYTIQVDVDGDGDQDDVTVTETYQVAELDGDENTITEAEQRWVSDNAEVQREVTVTINDPKAKEPVQFTFDLNSPYSQPAIPSTGLATVEAFEAETGVDIDEAAIIAAIDEQEVDTSTGAIGLPAGSFGDSLISQRAARETTGDWVSYCGPTALLMLLDHFGLWEGEVDAAAIVELATALGTTRESGTSYTAIRDYAEDHGLEVTNLNGDGQVQSWDDFYSQLFGALENGQPVLLSVGFNAFTGETDGATTHYVIVTGYENGNFRVVDPWTGQERTLTWDQFHDAVQGRLDVLGPWTHYYMLTFSPARAQ